MARGSNSSHGSNQGPRFSVVNFAKFHNTIREILHQCYPQIPYILQPVGVVVLANNTSKYKEFTVTVTRKHITLGH